MDIGEQKTRLRRRLTALPAPSPETRSKVITEVGRWLDEQGPAVVVGFLAMGDEIDMTPLVDDHPRIRFALTRTAPGVTLTVHDFAAPRETHRFGFDQPAADAPRIPDREVDVVLVPGIAFSPSGVRLGRGAGYYDRFLAGLRAETVALTTNDRVHDALPIEPHDVRVGWIATEDGVSRAR